MGAWFKQGKLRQHSVMATEKSLKNVVMLNLMVSELTNLYAYTNAVETLIVKNILKINKTKQ